MITIGIGILVALLAAGVVYWGLITLGKLLDHIADKIKKHSGRTVIDAHMRDMIAQELANNIDEKQTRSLSELRAKLHGKEILTGEIDNENRINPDTIEIIDADEWDKDMQEIMDAENGTIILTA